MDLKKEIDFFSNSKLKIKQENIFTPPLGNIKAERNQCVYFNNIAYESATIIKSEPDYIFENNLLHETQIEDIPEVKGSDYFVSASDLVNIREVNSDIECSIKTEISEEVNLETVKNEPTFDYWSQPKTSQHQEIKRWKIGPVKKRINKYKHKYCPVCIKSISSIPSTSRTKHFYHHFKKHYVICRFCAKFFIEPPAFLSHYIIHKPKIKLYKFNYKNRNKRLRTKKKSRTFNCEISSEPHVSKSKYCLHAELGPSFSQSSESYLDYKLVNVKIRAKSQNAVKSVKTRSATIIKSRFKFKPFKKPLQKCKICAEMFKSKIDLKIHHALHDVKVETVFKCKFCYKTVKSKNTLCRHEKTHTIEKPYYNCSRCLKTFKSSLGLHSHEKRVHEQAPEIFECEVCSDVFVNRVSFMQHCLLHPLQNEVFKCDNCYVEFKQKETYQKHIGIQKVADPFNCEICQKKFTLKCHSFVHVKHKCDSCFTKFKDKTTLIQHTNENSILEPYFCKVCSKNYYLSCHQEYHTLGIVNIGSSLGVTAPLFNKMGGRLNFYSHDENSKKKAAKIGEGIVYSCQICPNVTFKTKNGFTRHKNERHCT